MTYLTYSIMQNQQPSPFLKNPYTNEEIEILRQAFKNSEDKYSVIVPLDDKKVFVFRTGHFLDNCTKGKSFKMSLNGLNDTFNQPEPAFQTGKFIFGTSTTIKKLKEFICKKANNQSLFDLELEDAQKYLRENIVNCEVWNALPSFIKDTQACDEILRLLYACSDVKDEEKVGALFFPSNWKKPIEKKTTPWAGRFYGLGIDTKLWDKKRFEWMMTVRCEWAKQCSSYEELKEFEGLKFAELQIGKSFENQWMVSSLDKEGKEKGMNWLGTVYDLYFEKMKELGRLPEVGDFNVSSW